jgi:hypothetical protein
MTRSIRIGLLVLVLASSAQAAVIFGASNVGNLYTVDPFTGATSLIGAMGVVMFDIAYHPSVGLLGVTGGAAGDLYRINPTTGAVTLIGNTGFFLNALAFNPTTGVLYAASGNDLYTVNVLTGAGTLVGSDVGANQYSSSGDLEFDGAGNLYLTSLGPGPNDWLYRLDPATGDGTRLGNMGFALVYGLAYQSGVMYGFTSGGQVITVNLATGAGTAGPAYGLNFYGATYSDIPEPALSHLVGVALAGLAGWRLRRRSPP